MPVPLAGGGLKTLLSEVGLVLLPLFISRDACAQRLVCRDILAAVPACSGRGGGRQS